MSQKLEFPKEAEWKNEEKAIGKKKGRSAIKGGKKKNPRGNRGTKGEVLIGTRLNSNHLAISSVVFGLKKCNQTLSYALLVLIIIVPT